MTGRPITLGMAIELWFATLDRRVQLLFGLRVEQWMPPEMLALPAADATSDLIDFVMSVLGDIHGNSVSSLRKVIEKSLRHSEGLGLI